MQILYFNSFLRTFKKLPFQQQVKTNRVISDFIFSLERKTQIPQGIGLKRLTKYFWEIRAGLNLRILFTIEQDTFLSFVFVGSHNEIRRYLKKI